MAQKEKQLFSRTDAQTLRATLKIFREELFRNRRHAVTFIAMLTTGHIFRFVIIPLLLSFIVQALLSDSGNIELAYTLVLILGLAAIVSTLLNNKGFTMLFNHEESVQTRLLNKATDHLMKQSYQFFSNHKVGTLSGDVMNFARSYLSVMDAYFLHASQLLTGLIASLVVVGILSPPLLIPLTLITAGIIALNIRNLRERTPYRNERKRRTSQLSGTIADIMGNQILTKVFSRETHELREIIHERQKIEKIAKEEITIIERESLYRQALTYTFQIITLLVAVYMFSVGNISIAALVFMVTYLIRTSESIFQISSLIRQFEQAFLDASPMVKILQEEPTVNDVNGAEELIVQTGSVSFNNVTFSYADAQDDAVFNNLSLAIPSGQRVGLAGHSGGGKTTLTKLLLRFADIDGGAISIDGRDIHAVTQASLREAIAYVPQEPFLFHRTLRENIAYGKPDATSEEIYKAAKQAHALEFIENLPQKFDTVVGERGVKLSGGQRQRLAIARAILKDAPILVLDEATSALDSESEKLIQESLDELMKGRTSIIIAHRLSTIAKLDRIIVLDNGMIVEDGSHAELLNKNGTYAKLWAHQSGGFLEE